MRDTVFIVNSNINITAPRVSLPRASSGPLTNHSLVVTDCSPGQAQTAGLVPSSLPALEAADRGLCVS